MCSRLRQMTVERRRMSDRDHEIHSILVFNDDNNIIIIIIMICLRFRLGEILVEQPRIQIVN